MPFTLDQVVPWGRSFEEYVAIFALTSDDLSCRILGCGDGPAAFNSGATRRGAKVVSVDPIYAFSLAQLKTRIDAVYEPMLAETARNEDEFVWRHVRSVAELGRLRRGAMDEFLLDYKEGLRQRRYVAGGLPSLEFSDRAFDLALCSHFLFLYSEHYSLEFHLRSINELCRIAKEVRIFPLNELGARKSRHLDEVIVRISDAGILSEVVGVEYEFQKGANQFLRVRKA